MPLFYDKRYGTYNYIWREAGRQHWKSLGKDRKVAKIKANEYDRRRALGELAPLLVRAKIEDHLKWFLKYHVAKKRPATRASYKYCLQKLLAFFDKENVRYLDQITRHFWEKFEAEIFGRYSTDTRNDLYAVLSLFLNLAVQNNLLIKNPLQGVRRRLKNPAQRIRKVFSEEEISRLRQASPADFVPVIDLMLLTGLRRAEIWSLEWGDIDFPKRTLTVQAKPDIDFTPKDYDIRTVDLSKQAIEILRTIKHPCRFVFDTGGDRPLMQPDALTHNFVRVRRKAGIKEGSLHTLRRTYASTLQDIGIDLRFIQGQLGHESLTTTERYLSLDGRFSKQKISALRYEAISRNSPQANPKQKTHHKAKSGPFRKSNRGS